jgi:hypothetical protein
MENNFFSGLSRTFEEHYPQIRPLVEETEQFYTEKFLELETKSPSLYEGKKKLKNATLIGQLVIDGDDRYNLLPRIVLDEKVPGKNNPKFYIITNPAGEALYIGTSLESFNDNGFSVSTITGGLMPPTNSDVAYKLYLGIMSAVRKYRYCKVYEIDTGYESVEIKNQYGETLNKKLSSKKLVSEICNYLIESSEEYPAIMWPGMKQNGKTKQDSRSEEIWEAVKMFKKMVKEKLIPINSMFDRLNGKKNDDAEKEDNKPFVEVELLTDIIIINFLKEIDFNSYDEWKKKQDEAINNLVSKKAIELCEPEKDNDVCKNKFLKSVISVPAFGRPAEYPHEEETEVYGDSRSVTFEKEVSELFGKDAVITYRNINAFGGNYKGVKANYVSDGTLQRIMIKTEDKNISLQNIRTVVNKALDMLGIKDKRYVLADYSDKA